MDPMELKKRVMGNLQSVLDDRMATRLKPKPMGAHEGLELHEGPEESPQHEASESQMEEKQEGDISKLTPEEQEELQRLYDKMGC